MKELSLAQREEQSVVYFHGLQAIKGLGSSIEKLNGLVNQAVLAVFLDNEAKGLLGEC